MNDTNQPKRIYHLRAFWIAVSILLIIIGIWFLVYANDNLRELFTSQSALREKILSFGNLGPAFIIIYHVFQVVAAPLPGQAIDLANGYIFGAFRGSLISLTGIFLGTVVAMSLARIFGRPILEHFFSHKKMEKLNKWAGHRSLLFFFVLFLIPGLPDDILCFGAGLTKIPLWKLILVAFMGRTPSIITSVVLGSTGKQLNPVWFIILIAIVSIALFILIKQIPKNKRLQKYIQ